MESRKQKEIEHYDMMAGKLLKRRKAEKGDFEGFNPLLLASFRFVHNFLRDKCENKNVLDYGCGNGIHSFWLEKLGAKIKAIDLSDNSLEFAREKVKNNVEFTKMDCENMSFPDNHFDIIFNSGTFSSLDLNKALSELNRVLKPEGFVIGIETFGHNPLTNFKRKINRITKKRTAWAASHITREGDLKMIKRYFNELEIHYFHLVSWLVFPFLNLPFGKTLLKLFEFIDRILLKVPFLRKYAFKIVFILKKPKK